MDEWVWQCKLRWEGMKEGGHVKEGGCKVGGYEGGRACEGV